MKGEELLGKVDSGKRDFLRKLAIGSAYAVPLMTTVSLDGAIKSARAQAAYGPPQVIRFGAAALPNGNFAVPPQAQVGVEIGYWFIVYDRPMNPAFNTAKAVAFNPPNGIACPDFDVTSCSNSDFAWFNGNTEERRPIICGPDIGPVLVSLKLNPPGCDPGTFYRDTEGNILAPFFGCADNADVLKLCRT